MIYNKDNSQGNYDADVDGPPGCKDNLELQIKKFDKGFDRIVTYKEDNHNVSSENILNPLSKEID